MAAIAGPLHQPAHPPSLASRFPRPSVFLGGHGAAPGRILISRHYRTKETNLIRKPRSWCQNPRMSNCSDLYFADILLLFFSRNHICRDVRLQLEGRCQLRSHGPWCVFVCVCVCVSRTKDPPRTESSCGGHRVDSNGPWITRCIWPNCGCQTVGM